MDIGRSISFIFADRSWVSKVLICGLLFFVPIIGWLLIGGYVLRLLHNVIVGEEPTLPEWNNWGGDIAGGLKAFVVGIVWAIPIFIIQGIGRAIDVSILTFLITVLSWVWGAVSVSALSDLAVSGNMADALKYATTQPGVQQPRTLYHLSFDGDRAEHSCDVRLDLARNRRRFHHFHCHLRRNSPCRPGLSHC